MNRLVKLYHQLGSPPYFYKFTGYFSPWLLIISIILGIWGLYDGLILAPVDYQMGDAYRIIFVHVPAAWMSMFIYLMMAIAAIMTYVWRMKVAEAVMLASAPIGAAFTVIALVTGMLWGKPMWGTYWDWDARMTSELILLFLYIGIMAVYSSFSQDSRKAARIAAIVAIVGIINLIVIRYSVYWWSSIHQGASISLTQGSSIKDWNMLRPLLIMAISTKFYYLHSLFFRSRIFLLETEQNKKWVKQTILESKK